MSVMSDCAISLDCALEYADRGWHVLACKPGEKDPYFPLAPKAYLSATNDRTVIEAMFDKKPNINIGIAAIQSGLVIIDIDNRNLLTETGLKLAQQLRNIDTWTVRTGDGFHLYFADPGNVRIPGKIREGIETKHKGYVVAAPSRHPNGSYYQVINETDPAPLPLKLLGLRP